MKKLIIGLCVIIVMQALCIVHMNSAIGKNTKYIEVLKGDIDQNIIYIEALEQYTKALDQYTKAQIYKKDAQLFLMNSLWNNPKVHKLLADSCKKDCIKYRNGK